MKSEEGTATIEFVIFFPLIMTIFLTSFEVSILVTRTVMLERSLDINVRQLRLGEMQPATADQLRLQVCQDTMLLSNCPSSVMIELTPVSTTTWNLPDPGMTCVDRTADIQPVVSFNLGGVNDLMIVRACAVVDPFFSTTPFVMGLPLDGSGGYVIAAASTFVNEP